MTDERFKEIYNNCKSNPLQLCWVYFCEEKKHIPQDVFLEHFQNWILTYNMNGLFQGKSVEVLLNESVSKIEKYLKEKHKL